MMQGQLTERKLTRGALIDDAMWGFPLGGVFMGVTRVDEGGKVDFSCEEVPVRYFQTPLFEEKEYLRAVADLALKQVEAIDVPGNEKIKVCQGYVNSLVPRTLRSAGYDNVQTGRIGEPLQSLLEEEARVHVEETLGCPGCYYDPKDLNQHQIRKAFWNVVRWAEKNGRLDLAKTGWSFWKRRLNL